MNLTDAAAAVRALSEVWDDLQLSPVAKALCGPAAAELGETFADRVRFYRYARSLEMYKKAVQMAIDVGFTPKAVPIKLLFPILDGASFEEDEDLHTMWAALLANAGDPRQEATVHPAYIDVLKQLTPKDAQFLKAIYDEENHPDLGGNKLYEIFAGLQTSPGDSVEQCRMSLDNIFRLRLLNIGATGGWGGSGHVLKTTFGKGFVNAGTAPRINVQPA